MTKGETTMNAEDTERLEEIADSIKDFEEVIQDGKDMNDKRLVACGKAEIKSLLAERAIIEGEDPETVYKKYDIKANEGIHNGPGSVYRA